MDVAEPKNAELQRFVETVNKSLQEYFAKGKALLELMKTTVELEEKNDCQWKEEWESVISHLQNHQ
jgi:hypothetical protein